MSFDHPRLPGPFSPDEAASIAEIQQKIYFYGWCIDQRRFDELDALFLPDAIVHYDVPDGTRAPWAEIKSWLPQGLEIFRTTQHNMSNPLIELDGDAARARTYGQLLHVQELSAGGFSVMRHHANYEDEWARRDGVWRIATRTLRNVYVDGPILRGDAIVVHRVAKHT